ncbi:acetyltransferase [Lentilactobacillus parafarraginis]|uniref:ATP synthase F0, A subunit n=3 Tax=Lentilactobacillus parafarraginis TaxID=390842 RepID=A0A0R1YMP3_9LACO|nr:acyltransferase family protein [Lentilactobacillus parafarraginis]EHM00341.1 putative ATP synthase F0, A subunit [Lentilactobacillus parafarraginis F0439]KRM40499.1 ATP synthase F0, A subunit [Lentilactobacillus parafarraginis DSM 18390 = JCM 14109]TLQ15605.1 acetyltransferase [Lentilactobacillus parafarraginis]
MQQVRSQQTGKRLKKSRYITGFDGIRALAVVGVIVYHLLPYNLQGGYLGVPTFFVVSGYLITDLLLQEWEQNGRIDFLGFYARRLKRLYPALVFMLVATGTYITLFERSLLTNLRSIITTNMLYLYNWWEVGHGQSYFDRFNGESPFTHLWSLSIEGQYYLIWPLILIAFILIIRKKKNIAYLLLGLGVFSGILMGVLYTGPDTLNRVYYGTDTRMFSIIFGALLAIIWPSTHLKKQISTSSRWTLNVIGILSILVMAVMFFELSGQNTFTYRGGMFIMAIVSTTLVAACAHPGADVNRWLTNPVFSWIGSRSYGIYLYQFPVMIFYEMRVRDIAANPLLNATIEIVLIMVISELSYRYIERPLRHYHYKQLGMSIAEFLRPNSQYGLKRLWLVPAMALVGVCLYGSAIAPTKAQKSALQENILKNESSANAHNKAALAKQKKARRLAANKRKMRMLMNKKLTPTQYQIAKKYRLTKKQYLIASHQPLTAIGDSIMADNSHDLQTVFHQAYVSAKVGRQIWQADAVLTQLKKRGELAPNVLINLGTNSPMTSAQIDKVVQAVGKGHRIFWVNTHVPTRNWETEVNATIAKAAKKYPHFYVIDWHGYSATRPDWFWQDNVHPNPQGNVQYTHLVAKNISQQLNHF